MFELIFLIGLSFYFIQLILFTIGVSKRYPKIKQEELPTITVLVAARNEEKNILDCLESLDKLIYPKEKLEIIIINDHSTDRTGEIISSFIYDKPKFKMIIPESQIGYLRGKANALANAINLANGEVILTTDADCTVSTTWALTHGSYYFNDVVFVGGFTTQENKDSFSGMQAIDFIYLLIVAAGAQNLGRPLSCIGNNMSYRKSVYDEIGGYKNLPFSITEDSKLQLAINKLNKYKMIYPLDPGGLVVSKPCPDLKTLYWQKKRWGVGGSKNDFIGFVVMAWGFISSGAMLLTPLFFSPTALYLCLFKIFADYFFVYPVFKRLNLNLKVFHFVAFEIYFIIYVVLLPFVVLRNPKVKWKGREY